MKSIGIISVLAIFTCLTPLIILAGDKELLISNFESISGLCAGSMLLLFWANLFGFPQKIKFEQTTINTLPFCVVLLLLVTTTLFIVDSSIIKNNWGALTSGFIGLGLMLFWYVILEGDHRVIYKT